MKYKSEKQKRYLQAQQLIEKTKQNLYAYNPALSDNAGIYIIVREDKNKKYAYVGQAYKILDRIAQHMIQYSQHIDISLKTRGLWYKNNPYGWYFRIHYMPKDKLNESEQKFIKIYLDEGYELYNIQSGGKEEGRVNINESKPAKNYHDGLKHGYKNALRDIAEYYDKYFNFTTLADVKSKWIRKNGVIYEIAIKKYFELGKLIMNGGESDEKN